MVEVSQTAMESPPGDLNRTLVEEAWDPIFVADEHGRHVFVNHGACALLGYERDELLALPFRDLVAPVEREFLQRRIDLLRPGQSADDERALVRKDGSSVVVEMRMKRLADGRMFAVARDIGARVEAERAAREVEARYLSLFENAHVGIFRSALDGFGLLDFNQRFLEIVEGTREEVLRASVSGSTFSIWKTPEERSELVRRLHAREGGAFDAQIRTLKGNIKYLRGFAVLREEHGYFEGTIDDVTERRAAERALIDSEARYRSVVQAMSDGIVVHGADGSIVTANAAAERVLGLTADQMMGRTSLDPRWRSIREDGSPFPGDEHPGWITLHTGEPRTGVIMGVHKPSGELTWISINSRRVTPLGEEGAYTVVASFTDVTERRRADAELRASLREKEVLLREIHHRVKNNLQIISSLLALQSARTSDARLADLLRESQNRVASMALLHQQLYESKDLAEIPFGVYAGDMARSLYQSYGVEADRIGFCVAASDIALSIGVAVPCGLILNEIISNALKHAFPSGRRGTIRVELERVGDAVRLRVSDDGAGLPSDFEQRARTSLGVKLIERLVEQIGGELERTSSAAGTCYEVTFPPEGLL